VEIYGPEASGKTTLALHVIAEAQKSGGIFLVSFKCLYNPDVIVRKRD
jgi:RecA/RadA recombinase